jgi:hypothetical protein
MVLPKPNSLLRILSLFSRSSFPLSVLKDNLIPSIWPQQCFPCGAHSLLFDKLRLCGLCIGYVNWSCYLTKRLCYVRPSSLAYLSGRPLLNIVSRDSVVGIATGWTTKGSEFESLWGQGFSLLHVVQTGSGAHTASFPMGTGGSFPGGKAAGT